MSEQTRMAALESALLGARDVLRGILQSDIEPCIAVSKDNRARLDAIRNLHPEDHEFIAPTLRSLREVEALVGPGTSGADWLNEAIGLLSDMIDIAEVA